MKLSISVPAELWNKASLVTGETKPSALVQLALEAVLVLTELQLEAEAKAIEDTAVFQY